jgi:putative Holliday junction resolvase
MTPPSNEAKRAEKGRVLAIDFGRKRIGLALSDEMRLAGHPLATIERLNRREDLRRLREAVKKYGVQQIVVGLPVRLNGSRGEMADEAERFAGRIHKQLRLPVTMVDERLSSWEAKETLAAKGEKKRKKNVNIDAVAAAVILKDFLEREQQRK